MIITKLKGGLGNQLFQYSIGRILSLKNQDELKLDISDLESMGNRKYSLGYFCIEEKIATLENISKFLNKKNKIINLIAPYSKYKIINEKKFFDQKILKQKGNIYLNGYWQSWKYFSNINEVLKKELILKNDSNIYFQDIKKQIDRTNSISLHIRRGDYLLPKNSKIFPICPLSYYYEAIKNLEKTKNNFSIFVFSDDIDWARDNLKFNYPQFFIKNKNSYLSDCEELILMSKCKHNIIANSSFSWWGAWLNNNQSKIVIAPKKWFNDKTKNTNDLIPNTWIKI